MRGLSQLCAAAARWAWWVPLLLPSLWMWQAFPPLWRDSDGFYLLTAKPGVLMPLHWPPLYGFLTRGPLWLGALVEGIPFSFREPTLTDTGIRLILAGQHLLLWASAALVIATATTSAPRRLALSALFALVPVFYAFAHSVGTETLSHGLLLAAFAAGLAVLRDNGRLGPALAAWTALLLLAILTRHVNAVLAGVLPLAFLLRGLRDLATDGAATAWRRGALPFAISVAAGILAIGAAKVTIRVIAAAAETPYRSRTGYTLQRRLGFLGDLPPGERAAFFDAVAARLRDPVTLAGWQAHERLLAAGGKGTPDFLSDWIKAHLLEAPGARKKEVSFATDQKMNAWSAALLRASPGAYWQAVLGDVGKPFVWTMADMTEDAFACTRWFAAYLHEPRFAPLRGLESFREGFHADAVRAFEASPYLRLGSGLPAGLAVTAILLVAVGGAVANRRAASEPRWIYAVALLGTIAVMFLLNGMFTRALPRFALPLLSAGFAAAACAAGASPRLRLPSAVTRPSGEATPLPREAA